MKVNKYFLEVILFSSYMFFAMSWVGAAGFMKEIMLSTSMTSLTQASFLSTALTFAKIIGTFIAAWTIVKLGIRNAFTIAAALMCLSIVTPLASNFEILLVSRFFMGLGGALVIVYFNPIVYQYFEPQERAVVNGLNAIAFNVGAAVMMFGSHEFVVFFGGWQQALIAISVASIAMLILWIIFGQIKLLNSGVGAADSEKYSLLDGLKDKFNWIFALTYSGLLSFYIVLFTFYPKAGISESKQVILFGIIGAVAGIIYSRRTSKRIGVLRISGLIQLIAVFGLSFAVNPSLISLCAAILGFFMFLPMPALVTYGQERKGMTAQKVSVTFSLFWSISYAVATIVPTIFARIVDINNGDYHLAFGFICCISGSFLIGSLFLKEHKK